jgi:hypothetical protein
MAKKKDKKIIVPSLKAFSGEEIATDIFEGIMQRKYWCVPDRDKLADIIESTVEEEIERQKKHGDMVAHAKAYNEALKCVT